MEPIFTLQYGEFAVADYLQKNIKDASLDSDLTGRMISGRQEVTQKNAI